MQLFPLADFFFIFVSPSALGAFFPRRCTSYLQSQQFFFHSDHQSSCIDERFLEDASRTPADIVQ
jgi:hypothetical protein